MSVRNIILEQFIQVANEQGKQIPTLSDDLILVASPLDSLCFAIIVARLEDALCVDPFSAEEEWSFPVTFGEFVSLYERATRRLPL